MFCPQCGSPNPDDSNFCEQCGASLRAVRRQPAAAAVPPVTAAPPRPAAPASYAAPAYAVPFSPVTAAVKKLASSPLYLAGAITYTCTILFTLAATAFGGAFSNPLYQLLNLFAGSGGYGSALDSAMDELNAGLMMLNGASLGWTIVGQLPAIAIAAGTWLMFAAARDRSGAPMSTAGLLILKIVAILQLVLTSLGLLASEAFILFLTISLKAYDDSILTLGVVLMLAAAVLIGLAILYYAKLISTLDAMQKTIRTQQPSGKVSAYVAVLSILNGVFTAFGIFTQGNNFLRLCSLCGAAAAICFGVYLFKYKGSMRAQTAGIPS